MSKRDDTGKIETFYYFILIGLTKAVTYFVLLVLANFFILPDYGRASFVLSAFRTVALFGSIGLPFIFVPWAINKKDTSSVFYFLLFFNLILTAIGLVAGLKYPWILPIVFVIPLMAISGISNSLLRIKHKYHIIQFLGMLLEVSTLIGLVLFAKYGKAGIIGGHALAFYIVNFVFIYLTRKELWEIAKVFRFDLSIIWEYLKKGTITTLLYLSFAFLNWIDSLVLGYFSTFENVARYNVAGPISNVLAIIPFALSMFLLTRESELKNKKRSKSVLKSALRISFTLSLLVGILMLSLIFPLLKIFFPKYIGIEPFVTILSAGILLYSLYSLLYIYETGKLEPERAFWPIFLAAVINLILDIALIPRYGLYGITAATTIAHAFAFVTLSYKMGLLKEFFPAFLMLCFLPLSYYAGVIGIILMPIALCLSYWFGLFKEGDLFAIARTVFQIFERFR